MERRVFENPLIKDKVTMLKYSRETDGAFTLVEVELQPGGGTPPHYHTTFSEEFTAIDGILGLQLDTKQLRLQPGQQAMASIKRLHRFYNPGEEPIRFQVRLVPGSERFENMLKIMYGLASDGLVNKKGLPKSLDHTAVLITEGDTNGTGLMSLLFPLLRMRAKKLHKKGLYQALLAKYA